MPARSALAARRAYQCVVEVISWSLGEGAVVVGPSSSSSSSEEEVAAHVQRVRVGVDLCLFVS